MRAPFLVPFAERVGFVAEPVPCPLSDSGALTARTVPFAAMNPTPNMAPSPQPAAAVASDGTELEAEVSWPADAAAVAVLSHPHPLYGGDMWNPLIDHLFRALPAAGIAALRYNFRGTGSSGGSHDDGKAERLDAAAAFDAAVRLAAEQSGGGESPAVVSAGWSFGGDVSLAADHHRLSAWIGIAAPLRIVDPADMAAPNDPRPKLLLVPQHDQFRSPAEAAEIAAGWTNTRLEVIAGGDHFLMGHARAVADLISEFVSGLSR